MNGTEFKRGDVHCWTDCGYMCKAQVLIDLVEHYNELIKAHNLEANGWRVETWHNSGHHAVLKHDASGFMLSDAAVSGGIEKMHRHAGYDPARRFGCYNYDLPEHTKQIWVYAPTPWQAIGAVIREAQAAITGYRSIIGALAPQDPADARRADLYGSTPATAYGVVEAGQQGDPCPRCGRTTSHPEGWHYCHALKA